MKEKNNEELSFFEKYKTDKKFNAKVQLIGYGIFILILIVFLNISSLGNNSSSNITSFKNSTNNHQQSKIDNQQINLLQKLSNNYEYDIKAKITTKRDDNKETKEVEYYGKSAKNNMEIIKKVDNTTINYYKVDNRYYTKEGNNFTLIKDNEIYNILEKEYVELNYIKEYIEKSSLDHKTEYSNGKKEYVYHMKVKEIIKSYPEIDEIEINITEEDNTLTIKIDYITLMKALNMKIEECEVTYTYKNINTTEDFTIIEEQQGE